MRFTQYVCFLMYLIGYKIDMFFAYAKFGKFWRGLLVDIDYFTPYTFKLMAKSYYGKLDEWEKKIYREIRVKHNNSNKDHWEHYVINNAPNTTEVRYEVSELADASGELFGVVNASDKKIICLMDTKEYAEEVCTRLNTNFCKPYIPMPDVCVALMIQRWAVRDKLKENSEKYFNGDYSLRVKTVKSYLEEMYPDFQK